MLRKNLIEIFFSGKDKMLFVNSIQKPELLGYWYHFLIAVYVGAWAAVERGFQSTWVILFGACGWVTQ
jgi:hypothetical protein